MFRGRGGGCGGRGEGCTGGGEGCKLAERYSSGTVRSGGGDCRGWGRVFATVSERYSWGTEVVGVEMGDCKGWGGGIATVSERYSWGTEGWVWRWGDCKGWGGGIATVSERYSWATEGWVWRWGIVKGGVGVGHCNTVSERYSWGTEGWDGVKGGGGGTKNSNYQKGTREGWREMGCGVCECVCGGGEGGGLVEDGGGEGVCGRGKWENSNYQRGSREGWREFGCGVHAGVGVVVAVDGGGGVRGCLLRACVRACVCVCWLFVSDITQGTSKTYP